MVETMIVVAGLALAALLFRAFRKRAKPEDFGPAEDYTPEWPPKECTCRCAVDCNCTCECPGCRRD